MGRTETLYASANRGVGLWTSICLGFSNFFGFESNAVNNKQETVLEEALDDIEDQMDLLKGEWRIINTTVSWSGKFSVSVIAVVELLEDTPNLLIVDQTNNKNNNVTGGNNNIVEYVNILRNALNMLYNDKSIEEVKDYIKNANNKNNYHLNSFICKTSKYDRNELQNYIRSEINKNKID